MKYRFNIIFALSLIGLFLGCANVFAEISEPEREQLKQEIIDQLMQSDSLKQKIMDEIKLHETQKSIQGRDTAQQRTIVQNQIQTKLRPVALERDRLYGNADALISVVEFADFDCPYCRKIHPVLKRLVDDSGGTINWVFRHFPISGHKPNAEREAEAAECAGDLTGQQGFWKFTNALFLQARRGVSDSQAIIDRALVHAEIDKEDLLACLNAGKFKDKVKQDEDEALALGLQGTPANVLINHKTGQVVFRQGAASLETLSVDVDQLLGKSH
ncbi:DsbA family protein [Methylomonas sp. LL1]|uniref:DsbA family protein n=1 Tax=Methylomonas sp. LL1 TaxID=2785785 RepID=UPI0018C3A733|nr:DsbA family protein [Methylomonas sp. LL1]QPK62816.1 DsbA family protein [Methylomonas sp. LL1]